MDVSFSKFEKNLKISHLAKQTLSRQELNKKR